MQFPIIALYLSLLYKQVIIGASLLLLCSAMSTILLRKYPLRMSFPACLGTIYTALASISAFMVSWPGGVSRTIQFVLVLLSAIAIVSHLQNLAAAALDRFRIRFAAVNLAIMAHVVAFHVFTGRVVTWKYLYDTKFIFSAIVVVLFLFEDRIRSRSPVGWFVSLASISAVVLMSGERKAYILLGAIFLVSRASLVSKATTLALSAATIMMLVSAMPQSYIAHQISSKASDPDQLSNRFFFTVDGIGRRSDYIRTFVNRNAQSLFERHPVLGTGATGYANWARETYGSVRQSKGLSMNVHGERYRIPAENGIVGIIIALAFLLATTSAALRFAWVRGGFAASSYARFPLYMTLLLVSYIYGEAMDTTMLLLILLAGFAATGQNRPVSARPLSGQTEPAASQDG